MKIEKGKKFISFGIISIEPVTTQEALLKQQSAGYPPAGYNFIDFKCVEKTDSTGKDFYEATWKCYSSAD